MIYKNGNLVLQVSEDILEMVDNVQKHVQKKIGAIYRGTQLIWLTVYDAIKSCFGSGTWLGDKPWLGDESWKNN